MDGQEEDTYSAGETQPDNVPVEDESEQKTQLENEIKKIISNLDVKFDEENEVGTSVTTHGSPSNPAPSSGISATERTIREESAHYWIESASTQSAATTIVNQRVPPKVSVSHVKSERFSSCSQFPGNQTPFTGIPHENQVCYVSQHDFYQPERDEITDPISCETVPSNVDILSTSCDQTTSSEHPRARQLGVHHGYSAPLPEEPIRDFSGACEDEIAQPSYDRQMNPLDYQLPYCTSYDCQPVAQPVRYEHSSNVLPSEPSNVYQYPTQNSYEPSHLCRSTLNPQKSIKENVNRYNSAHMTYCTAKDPKKPKRATVTEYLLQKSRSFFNRRSDSESGETVPQLYKACIKNGSTPQRFTFKAVTGVQPPCVVRCQRNYDGVAPYPSCTAHPQHTTCVLECERIHGYPSTPMHTQSNNNMTSCCPQELPRKSRKNGCPEKGFEVIDKPTACDCGMQGKNPKLNTKPKALYTDLGCGYVSQSSVPEKVDIYCFDQLNTGFFRTSDHPPPLFADIAVQQTEKYATVFWAEIFGVVNVAVAFVIAMILQTFKFILQGIIRPIMIGMVQLLSDYLIKPFLTLLYNGFTQPISIFFYNVIASIRDVLQPLAKGLGYFVELIAVVLRSIRLVEVKNVTNIAPCNPCAPQTVNY